MLYKNYTSIIIRIVITELCTQSASPYYMNYPTDTSMVRPRPCLVVPPGLSNLSWLCLMPVPLAPKLLPCLFFFHLAGTNYICVYSKTSVSRPPILALVISGPFREVISLIRANKGGGGATGRIVWQGAGTSSIYIVILIYHNSLPHFYTCIIVIHHICGGTVRHYIGAWVCAGVCMWMGMCVNWVCVRA